MPEVLSPCGGSDSVVAAVRSGADAVYLGVGDFNARRNAANFTFEDLKEAARYCHVHGVKVYITLNTLVSDRELGSAVDCAAKAAECGADAFIVQDLGLASALSRCLPDIPLHASTQMSIHSEYGLTLLSELGFRRVVAAREMDRRSLEKMCRKAKSLGMEVEVFVHGALCMCVSGQCLMSSVIGGRSGNRGLCAQPCRLPFAVNGGNGYALSLRDLSLISHLGELADIGVDSFKIEGRMKRPEYVAAATAACRSMTDLGYVPNDISDMLASVFSRSGFTDGYYTGHTGKEMFGIRTEADMDVSSSVFGRIHELYRRENGRVKIKAEFHAASGDPVKLTLSDGENTVTVKGEPPQIARERAADEEYISSRLARLGGTAYTAESIKCFIGEGLSVPSSVLNELKKRGTEELDRLRSAPRKIKYIPLDSAVPHDGKQSVPEKTESIKYIARFSSADQLPDNLTGISAVILPIESDFSSLGIDVPVYCELPRYIAGNEEKLLERLRKVGDSAAGAVCSNLSAAELAQAAGLPIVCDQFFNIFNSGSAAVVSERFGALFYTASVECSAEALLRLPAEKAVFAYGRIPLMVTRNCPGKSGRGCAECGGMSYGTDRLKNRFPYACRSGYTEIFNDRPIYVLDRIKEFSADIALLYFTFESRSECESIIDRAIKGLPPEGIHTRGLYYRKVF